MTNIPTQNLKATLKSEIWQYYRDWTHLNKFGTNMKIKKNLVLMFIFLICDP